MPLPPLPDSFLFGTGNSDCQCEAYIEQFADIRDVWYEEHHLQPRLRATDFWNRYQEDIDHARDLGCKMFRFSVAWARVEPAPKQINQDALDHYSKVIDAILAAGMQPFVTLLHFAWPLHIQDRGGFLADDFPALFTEYCSVVARRMDDRVKYWATFNEPNILSAGYIKPWWEQSYAQPPGLPPGAGFPQQRDALHQLMRNLFLAHTQARAAIRRINPNARVGANPALLGLPVWLQRFMDRNVTNLKRPEDDGGQAYSERGYLEQGKVDLILAAFTKTRQRSTSVDFGEIYLRAAGKLMVTATSVASERIDPRGKVAVVAKSTEEAAAPSVLPAWEIISVDHHEDALRRLDRGEVTAIFADDIWIRSVLRQFPNRYRMLPRTLTDEPYAPAMTKGNPQLLAAVNRAVRQFIDSGEWKQSYARNLGEPVPALPSTPPRRSVAYVGRAKIESPKAVPSDLLARILRRGRIRIGVKADIPGLGFRNQKGEWSGLEVDLARAISRQIFGRDDAVELVAVASKDRMSMLRTVLMKIIDPLYKLWGILATSSTTSWWNLGMAGKLPDFLCPEGCAHQLDFVAFDYYWGISTLAISRIIALVNALLNGRMEVAPVYPAALRNWLKEIGRLFPNLEIFICENGCVTVADGIDRSTYIREHVLEVQRAVAQGVKVAGYLNWSITSNRELGHIFAPDTDFGLFHIELDADPQLVRQRTPSADVYRDIIRQRGAS